MTQEEAMEREAVAHEIRRLREALELSAERFDDLANLADRGQMENGGFLRASAVRIRKVLNGEHYHADIFA